MNRSTLSLLLVAQLAQGASRPKYGPSEGPRAVPLSASNEYFRSPGHPSPGFWALIGHYVPQLHSYSCTVASVAMVLNAAAVHRPKTSEEKLITQQGLLARLAGERWSRDRGTSLDRLGHMLSAALKAYGFNGASVRIVHVSAVTEATMRALTEALRDAEGSGRTFVIANFNQGFFMDDADVGHTAPIGAYDEGAQRVLILDPDREYYEPYWISLDTFASGLATRSGANVYRGYIVVTLGS